MYVCVCTVSTPHGLWWKCIPAYICQLPLKSASNGNLLEYVITRSGFLKCSQFCHSSLVEYVRLRIPCICCQSNDVSAVEKLSLWISLVVSTVSCEAVKVLVCVALRARKELLSHCVSVSVVST